MRHLVRVCILAVAVIALPVAATAAPIVVGEFRWDVLLLDPGADPDLPPVFSSTYSLTGLWDGPGPAPTLNGVLNIGDATSIDWLPVGGDGGFDQVAFLVDSLPALTATTSIFFDFAGETRTLLASLAAPGGVLLEFDFEEPGEGTGTAAVPEPATLQLLALGLAVAMRKRMTRWSKGSAPIA